MGAPDEVPEPLPGKMRRIGIMTSGGDSPGMNGFVRAVARQAIASGCEAYAVHEGYDGLVAGGDQIRPLKWGDVRGWLSDGGTNIGSARCKAFYQRPGRLTAAKNMILAGIDALVICGGDGSLTGADVFRYEWPALLEELVAKQELTPEQVKPFQHLNIVGAVGSIDNDMALTDATIGCYSSLGTITSSIDSIESTAASHKRAFVIEVMGRSSGFLAIGAALSTEADYCFFPEKPPSENWEEEMCRDITERRKLGARRTIVVVAEGAHDSSLNKITCNRVCDLLTKLGLDTRITTLGHVQRGGNACAYDRLLSTLQGVEAVRAVLDATPKTPTYMIGMAENKIVRVPLVEAVQKTKDVATAIKNRDFKEALRLRGDETSEYVDAYLLCTRLPNPANFLPQNKRMRVAIIGVGAPAGGINAAIRAVVMYCLSNGHTPVAIYNGFSGLCRHHDDKPLGSVRELSWLDVESWTGQGGSEIGINRTLPSEDMATTAHCFELYKFDALFVVGGFEGFAAIHEMYQERKNYDAFKIPMVLLPATVSNNIPGSDYSIGADTCLNALVNYCDTIRQSASSSRRRVFIIETQGGRSGYIATMGGLAVGALAVYTPEEGITLRMLSRDIEYLRRNFENDKGQGRAGKLILRNEKASETYTTKMIQDMIKDEAKGRFEARYAVPGHVQQGGRPSPMDRMRAQRLAVKCVEHLELFAGKTKEAIANDPQSASVIGIKGTQICFTGMDQADKIADFRNRRPLQEFWVELKDTIDMLSGRPKPQDCCPECGRSKKGC